MAKVYRPVSPLSLVSNVFEKLVDNKLLDNFEKCGLLSDMVSGLLDQQQIFWQLYLVELLGLLISLGLLELQHLI